MHIHLTKEQKEQKRSLCEERHRKNMKDMYENAVKNVEGGGTSITHEEQLNFKIALFPLIMQVIYNCEQLMTADIYGTWYKFRDGDYSAAMFDCQTVLMFARRILGFEPQHRVEMENGEKRMFRILEGKDAKQILSDFREYVNEAQENDATQRRALFKMREAIEKRDEEIKELKDKYAQTVHRKENPLSTINAYKSFKLIAENISNTLTDMENSVCMTKDHAERQVLMHWVKMLKKEYERAHSKVDKYRNYLENQNIYAFDKNGNVIEEVAVKAFGESVEQEDAP